MEHTVEVELDSWAIDPFDAIYEFSDVKAEFKLATDRLDAEFFLYLTKFWSNAFANQFIFFYTEGYFFGALPDNDVDP